jgi:Protein of unknown function (DUF1488)
MPLKRLNDEAFAEELEGVSFGMIMTDKGTTVQCFVSHAALTDKARASGQGGMQAFHQYRSEVEDTASAKYDAGNIESDGRVTVSSHDLNPEQFP